MNTVSHSDSSVTLSWLGQQSPRFPCGISWGVPWEQGVVWPGHFFRLTTRSNQEVPLQSWPMAYWPDGSIKWTGFSMTAEVNQSPGHLWISNVSGSLPPHPVEVTELPQSILIRTGSLQAVLGKSGSCLIQSLQIQDREVGCDGRLVVLREQRREGQSSRVLREEWFYSRIDQVTVEQTGPVRAVIRFQGVHSGGERKRARQWLPFTVRLYFFAGLSSIRLVHSFIFDGHQAEDFIKGLGMQFSVPFREQLQNRHIRLATDENHFFAEPVQMAPGYRPRFSPRGPEFQKSQMRGERIPDLQQMSESDRSSILGTPVWDSFKLTQLNADGWELSKRTKPDCSWLKVTGGRRARGFGYLGDVSGGLGVSLRRFWQKCPTGFEILNASKPTGQLQVWFWSPDAQAMDLRHYDTVRHQADIIYEDPRDIRRADPYGVANTSELTIWVTQDTPSPETLDQIAETGACPPLLVCLPEYYHRTATLGFWTLPKRPIPGLNSEEIALAEVQMDRAFRFMNDEIERRRWYGFWDYGDYRRTYDPIRHQWMYDIGGHGWNATELMPNLWLWFAFLRTGRADFFRAAEDMTRNTMEVDVHHLGPFAGLGSRHNVTHWGDGAKEPRINIAHLKRIHYYLTTDERMGDLIREPIDVIEQTLSHVFSDYPHLKPGQSYIRIGPDWLSLASNWLVEWERTGNPVYRQYLLAGMKSIGAMPDALIQRDHYLFDPVSKCLFDVGDTRVPGQFLFLFGGDQIVGELNQLIDCPEFKRAWDHLCEQFVVENRLNDYYATRLTAYAALTSGRTDLRDRAIRLYRGLLKFADEDYLSKFPRRVTGPECVQACVEYNGMSTFTPHPAVPELAQWALNLMTSGVWLERFIPRNVSENGSRETQDRSTQLRADQQMRFGESLGIHLVQATPKSV